MNKYEIISMGTEIKCIITWQGSLHLNLSEVREFKARVPYNKLLTNLAWRAVLAIFAVGRF